MSRFIGDEVADFFRRVVRDVTSYRDEHKIKRSDFMQLMMEMRSGHLEDDNGVKTDYSSKSIVPPLWKLISYEGLYRMHNV